MLVFSRHSEMKRRDDSDRTVLQETEHRRQIEAEGLSMRRMQSKTSHVHKEDRAAAKLLTSPLFVCFASTFLSFILVKTLRWL